MDTLDEDLNESDSKGDDELNLLTKKFKRFKSKVKEKMVYYELESKLVFNLSYQSFSFLLLLILNFQF